MSYKEILFWFVPAYDGPTCKYCTRCKYSKCAYDEEYRENNLYCTKFRHLFKTKNSEFPTYYWQRACCYWEDKYIRNNVLQS